MNIKKDKAVKIYKQLINEKQPMNLWEHIKNHQFKDELRKKMEEAAEHTPQTPDFVQDHINWLK